MAFIYQQILWYQNEATPKEQKKEVILSWLHESDVAPFFLWFGSVLCSVVFIGLSMFIDFLSLDQN